MKKWLGMLLALVLCLALTAGAEDAEMITGEELQKRMDENVYLNLFDVRPEEDYQAGFIPSAGNIPLDMLEEEIQEILNNGFSRMDVEIVAYGETQEQGEMAAAILKRLGFTNVAYLEGISAWSGEMDQPNQLLGTLDTVDIYGNKVDASILADKKLIMVNAWATYCNPCISEMADLARLSKEMEDQGLLILGLLTDATDPATLQPLSTQVRLAQDIAKATGADYPHLLPSRSLYQRIFGQIQYVPTTFFVDAQGAMVGDQAYIGAKSYSAWQEIIQGLMASQAE